jgi:hypothetical protein
MCVVLYGCETSCLTLREEETEGIWEQGAEVYIRAEEVWTNRRLEKTA